MGNDKKIDELVYRASLRKNFWQDIDAIRNKPEYGIPEKGFTTEPETTGWYVLRGAAYAEFLLEKNPEVLRHTIFFDDALAELLEKYNLPSTANHLLENYVLNNNTIKFEDTSSSLFAVENKNSHADHLLGQERHWRARNDNYVKLLIHELASKEDARNFIENNWGDIKKELRSGKTEKYKRIRITTNRERDALIYKLWNYTDEQLGMSSTDTRRDIIVARMIKELGYGELSDGTIRGIVNKQKKLRRE